MDTAKGFITVATGKEWYYKMAHNLLLSYRYHTKSQTPFAILCDRENEWTADFDFVVIIENPAFSYFDKMRILDLSPFDETIFIDADSLVYRDLSSLWGMFEDGPDVGVLGTTLPLDDGLGWWDIDNLGEVKGRVEYKLTCQGGVYYVRNRGKDIQAFIETCHFIAEHYLEYHFRVLEDAYSDEMIFSLASCVHHYKPVMDWVDVFAYFPAVELFKKDILSGIVVFGWPHSSEPFQDSVLIHFGTANARYKWLYNKEVFKLKRGAIRLSNLGKYALEYGGYCLLRINHAIEKRKTRIQMVSGLRFSLFERIKWKQ